jgi:hypothetical protein
MLKLVPFDFIQPSKLLLGLDAYDYVAVGPTGEVLGRGRVKELVLNTPGATGYFNLREAAPIDLAKKAPPTFDEKPWGSVGEIQTIPGQPLIEPVKINRPDLVVFDEATDFTPEQIEKIVADGPRRANETADKATKKSKTKKAK